MKKDYHAVLMTQAMKDMPILQLEKIMKIIKKK
jgi:hypothetical protein